MNLNAVTDTLYWTHIAFGFVAFFVAPIALVSAKGGRRIGGGAGFTSGPWSSWHLTAMLLSLYRPNYFLAFVSVFSFYLAFR